MTIPAFCKRATFKQRFLAGLVDHGFLLALHTFGSMLGGGKVWQAFFPMLAVVYFSQELRFKRTLGDRVMNLFITTSNGYEASTGQLLKRFFIVYGYFFILMLESLHPALRLHDTLFLTIVLAVFTGFAGVIRPVGKAFYDDFTETGLWYSSQTKFGYSGYVLHEGSYEDSPTSH